MIFNLWYETIRLSFYERVLGTSWHLSINFEYMYLWQHQFEPHPQLCVVNKGGWSHLLHSVVKIWHSFSIPNKNIIPILMSIWKRKKRHMTINSDTDSLHLQKELMQIWKKRLGTFICQSNSDTASLYLQQQSHVPTQLEIKIFSKI